MTDWRQGESEETVAKQGKVCAAGGVAKTKSSRRSTVRAAPSGKVFPSKALQHSQGSTKWKNVSFKGPDNAIFKSLHTEGKDAWRTAYSCYCQHFSFHITDLA
jgi:hypothetical protein